MYELLTAHIFSIANKQLRIKLVYLLKKNTFNSIINEFIDLPTRLIEGGRWLLDRGILNVNDH